MNESLNPASASPNGPEQQAASAVHAMAQDTAQPALAADAQPAQSAPNIELSRYVARVLDMSIKVPGTNFHVGADSVVGLMPVVGDLVTGAAGCVILADAARNRVPPEIMGKMVVNLGIDVAGGAVMPGIGDVFDVFWKANKKNLTLMEDHLGLERTFAKGGEETKDTEALKLQRNPNAQTATGGGGGNNTPKSMFAGLAGAMGGNPVSQAGGTRIEVLRSAINPKLEWVKYTFKVDSMERRSDTHVWGGGGGGFVYGSGGNVYGSTAPISINSRTTHKAEFWFTNENGKEEWVTINVDTMMVRMGQALSVLYTRRKGKRETFIAARNQSTGETADMSLRNAYGRADNYWPTTGTWMLASISAVFLWAAFTFELESLTTMALIAVPASFAPFVVTVLRRRKALRKEAYAFLDAG